MLIVMLESQVIKPLIFFSINVSLSTPYTHLYSFGRQYPLNILQRSVKTKKKRSFKVTHDLISCSHSYLYFLTISIQDRINILEQCSLSLFIVGNVLTSKRLLTIYTSNIQLIYV